MRRSLWLAALCLLAGALSYAYVVHYLRGGPRIIDATSYWLEARSFAAGSFSFTVPEPSAAFRGRFLLADADGHRLGVLFPPGYPLLLSLGMRAGVPLLVGPLLGALLVAATFFLARALGQGARVAWLAAGLSVVCAALRYHTADTMSHGLSALLGCLALGLALRADLRLGRLACGLCLGMLLATRPVSAAVALAVCLVCLLRARPRALVEVGVGMLPGVVLLLAHQHALTGSWLGSTQLAYYAASDAPAGCFRYGFGAGIGCRYEHGDFVSRFLPQGYGLRAAARNLLVHLGLVSVDATNAAPLTLLAVYAGARHARSPLGLAALAVLLQAFAYVPFYFDGNFPGGGARFLCEAIPFCQILVARAACDLRAHRFVLPAALAGLLLHARAGHEQLQGREGGRPMFEPAVLQAAGVERGLVFVDTDHAFNLGHDPSVRNPADGLLVARRHGDGHDRLLYERLGRPASLYYRYDPSGARPPELRAFVPPDTSLLEAEAEWPALLERGGAYPLHYPCASGGRALRLLPGTRVKLPLPANKAGALETGWVSTGAAGSEILVQLGGGAASRFRAEGPGCFVWLTTGQWPEAPTWAHVELVKGEGALDFVTPVTR
ncbi:MAG TPA: hypothetical protein VIW29_22510 [Polyangiaceae bacterium]